MSPYHWMVRLVKVSDGLYFVQLFDGKTWEYTHPQALVERMAQRRAEWLTDVLTHAETTVLAQTGGP